MTTSESPPMTDTAELIARLKPAWVIDEPVGEAVSIMRSFGGLDAVVDALNRFIVANNALKTEAADAIASLVREMDELRGETFKASADAAEYHRDRAIELWDTERGARLAAEAEVVRLTAEVERLTKVADAAYDQPHGPTSRILWSTRYYEMLIDYKDERAKAEAAVSRLTAENEKMHGAEELLTAQNIIVHAVWDALGGEDATRADGQNLVARVREIVARATAAEADAARMREALEAINKINDQTFMPALTAYEAAKGGGVDASFPTALSDSEVRIWINACNHEPARQALRQLLAYRVRGVSSALTSPASGEQDAPVGYVLVPQAAIDWLMGEGPDPAGLWFGDFPDDHPKPPGAFWWRSLFRSMLAKVKPQKDNDDGAAGKITGWAVVGADDLSGGILWECHDEADKGDTESLEKIELAADRFPIGTKVVITEPALRMEGK